MIKRPKKHQQLIEAMQGLVKDEVIRKDRYKTYKEVWSEYHTLSWAFEMCGLLTEKEKEKFGIWLDDFCIITEKVGFFKKSEVRRFRGWDGD